MSTSNHRLSLHFIKCRVPCRTRMLYFYVISYLLLLKTLQIRPHNVTGRKHVQNMSIDFNYAMIQRLQDHNGRFLFFYIATVSCSNCNSSLFACPAVTLRCYNACLRTTITDLLATDEIQETHCLNPNYCFIACSVINCTLSRVRSKPLPLI
jgi:hypothetical protein